MVEIEKAWPTAVLITGTIGAFFAAPMLPLIDPRWVAACGAAVAVGGGTFWLDAHRDKRTSANISLLIAAAGVAGIVLSIVLAMGDMSANNQRCAAIQREMLLPSPRRSDLPSMFEALRCVPKGDDQVQFPPRQAPAAKPR